MELATPTPSSAYPILTDGQLQFRLRDPQSSEPLFEVNQTLPSSDFPLAFSGVVYIPFECKTRLILGEVIFAHDGVAVTTQSFNVVTQVEHLLEAIDQGFSPELDQDDFPDLSNLDLGVLELPDLTDTTNRAEVLTPETTAVLPPKLNNSSLESRSATSLDLPVFGPSSTTGEVKPAPKPTPAVVSSEDLSWESNYTDISTSISPLLVGESSELIPATEGIEKIDPIAKPKSDPEVQEAFQALDLNSRFWSRLNALAGDQEWSQWVKRANVNPLPEIPFNAATNIVKRSDPTASDTAPLPYPESINVQEELEEIVVDDEPLESPGAFFPRRKNIRGSKPETPAVNQPISYILPEDQPVSRPPS